eukprot:894781-Ditylum_brightwellii.AAC.1
MPKGVIQLANIISEIVEVYVNDFILGAQPTSINHLNQISQAAITAILSVFPSTKQSNHINGREPILFKKVLKGDTRWEVHKFVLGFLLDGKARTIRPPPEKLKATLETVQELLQHTWVTPSKYCKVLGKMCHLAAIAPACLGLFTPLNRALVIQKGHIGLRKKSEVCICHGGTCRHFEGDHLQTNTYART